MNIDEIMKSRTWDPDNPEHQVDLRDFCLYTDGSGHQDGFGGCAALAMSRNSGWIQKSMITKFPTGTAQMEMEALIIGLQLIMKRVTDLRKLKKGDAFTAAKPTVIWLTDRQDLVLSMVGAYGKNANPDLWHHISWFEKKLDIHPFHVPRDTYGGNKYVDNLSSICRNLIKDFSAMMTGA